MPEEFTQIAFNPVTDNSAADFFAGCDAQSGCLKIVFTPHNKETAHSCFMLRGSELKEFSPLPQTCCFWKRWCSASGHAESAII